MSMSIYYTARRALPLTAEESAAITQIVAEYDTKTQQFINEGLGDFWEAFCIYAPADPSEPNVIFEGATQLPDSSEEAVWAGLQHWCEALSKVRLKVENAEWTVNMDDHEITWDESSQQFDPSM